MILWQNKTEVRINKSTKINESYGKKTDILLSEYNKVHDKFTSLIAQGRDPNVAR